ncbi:MAG: lamin tail domain-containing protein [Bacteroidales bacterium]|jgi:hypothetical protein|nr:lamin tail domain-containing protein [Bacteroidales bacterium]
MKFCGLLICILLLHSCLYGQISDDFSDGELLNNPTWLGNTDSFTVNSSFQLQLNASGAGSSYISTQLPDLQGDIEWKFDIRQSFAPSANNLSRFYLLSNTSQLNDTALKGYYLNFGEAGSADAVRLYKQNGNKSEQLCSSAAALIAASFSLKIKVVYSLDSGWSLFCSDNGGDVLQFVGNAADTLTDSTGFMGILCLYTASNRTNFWFDNIYCGGIYADTTSPVLLSYSVDSVNYSLLHLSFDEMLDSSVLDVSNYLLDNGIGQPLRVEFTSVNATSLQFFLPQPLPINARTSLKISGIKDIFGNLTADTLLSILLVKPALFDVIITEIMADPTPSAGLPEAEYIEIKNRLPFPISLNKWILKTGNYRRTINPIVLDSAGYALICAAADTSLFTQFGTVTSTSSMQITDAGQNIALIDNNSQIIHSLTFADTWHASDVKRSGGWALEMIDENEPCVEADNWTSSTATLGGTPCNKNAVNQVNNDITAPQILGIASTAQNVITVYFSEIILPQYLQNKSAFYIDKILIDSVLNISEDMKSVQLHLSTALQKGTIYEFSLRDTIQDCAGNIFPLNVCFSFGYAQNAEEKDVVINEILFNPSTDEGVDFVEIYNRSDKIIDLGTLRVSTFKSNGEQDTGRVISLINKQLLPHQYLVLTRQPQIVCEQYHCLFPDNLLQMKDLPNYANEHGIVGLNVGINSIDRFEYTADMHYPLYQSVKGVSLERIHFDRLTQDKNNWHSAASTAGYATPGYINSSFSENISPKGTFVCYPEIFSPDADGFDDILNIYYTFPESGYRVTIDIYNAQGLKLKTLINNELASTEGVFTWDGIIDGNIKATTGLYILLFRYWNLEGKTFTNKKTCVVATKK